jgi:uncharacterized protein YbjT (DUF2867 family)
VILVLGASGYTGLAVIRALRSRGVEVRGFIRNPDAEAAVRAAGASEIFLGDLRDLHSVEAAARGVDGIFFIGPRFMAEEAAIGKAVIDIAVKVGARRFVLSGVYHPTIRDLYNHQSKRAIEDHLYKTDLEFVILQPARYMHFLLVPNWTRVLQEGVLADAFATDMKFAYVDYNDVAEVAAISFHEDRLIHGTYELSADGQYNLHEVAEMLSAALRRPVRAVQTPFNDLTPARREIANPYSAEAFRRLHAYYNKYGFHGGNALVLSSILGRAPNTFDTFWQMEADCRRAPLLRITSRPGLDTEPKRA